MNTLYYGDNLDVIPRYIGDERVDLIYLDPPFKSNQDYNVLFEEQDGSRSAAQIKAFNDTWRWDQAAAAAYEDVVERGGRVSQVMQAFRTFLPGSDMLAYLAMMAPRLIELRRVLKSTGTIYLHCDPTASHYLKMLMDAVFGPQGFLNEIIWKRTLAHGSAKRFAPVHDTILAYSKSSIYFWSDEKTAGYDPEYVKSHFGQIDKDTGKPFQAISLTGAGIRRGESGSPWRKLDPTTLGRHWALPGHISEKLGISGGTVQDRLDKLDAAGRIYWPKKKGGRPRLKWFLDDAEGAALPDVWTDIPPINSQAKERLGYPTQKPEALLERILSASSRKGDTILDPFCGCGTAVAVAQRLGRQWIGIDITHLAITLIRHRLFTAYGGRAEYEVIGEPVSLPDAVALASEDKFQFQWWALGLVGARPAEQKKGADKGIDGRLYFHDEGPGGKTKQIILSVKGGDLKATDLRDLGGVVAREKADIGVLIALEEPTRPMRVEAASSGFYKQPVVDQGGQQYPRLQILTVAELLAGQRIKYPSVGYQNVTFKRAPRAKGKAAEQLPLVAEDQAEYGGPDSN